MLPDRVSNQGPLTYESGALPIALRGPAHWKETELLAFCLSCLAECDIILIFKKPFFYFLIGG